MEELSSIQRIVIWIFPVIFAITAHEYAHGWVAKRLGDTTAEQLGRLTLNPLRHIDPIGTVVLPIVLLIAGGFVFGWAKPVPINWMQLRNPKRDMAFVAVAGPLSNLLQAIIWALLLKLNLTLGAMDSNITLFIAYSCSAGIMINSVLCLLNLLPIPPLDGGRILVSLLPNNLAASVSRIEPFGMVILIVLLATGMLGKVLGPMIGTMQQLIISLVS